MLDLESLQVGQEITLEEYNEILKHTMSMSEFMERHINKPEEVSIDKQGK